MKKGQGPKKLKKRKLKEQGGHTSPQRGSRGSGLDLLKLERYPFSFHMGEQFLNIKLLNMTLPSYNSGPKLSYIIVARNF